MILYNLTLNRASGIQVSRKAGSAAPSSAPSGTPSTPAAPAQCAVYGNFSAPKQQEIVVSRGKILELLRPNEQGRLVTVVSTEVFGTVRSLAAFRLPGTPKDFLIVGSDSGRIVILDFNKDKNVFVKVHQETYGKSGCRRIVPGQYLAADPKGRACMIASVEKQKFVYVLNRDSAANLTISSPLEAHKSHTIVFSVAGLDCGYDNPIFAAIELSYEDADQVGRRVAARHGQTHAPGQQLEGRPRAVLEQGTSQRGSLGPQPDQSSCVPAAARLAAAAHGSCRSSTCAQRCAHGSWAAAAAFSL
jgi:splicing factor 3B subunit 3